MHYTSMGIEDLGVKVPDLSVRQPIQIEIQHNDGEFTAIGLEVTARGKSAEEAVRNLQDALQKSFGFFSPLRVLCTTYGTRDNAMQ